MIKQDIENLIKLKENYIKESKETIERHTRVMKREQEYIQEEKARLLDLEFDCKILKTVNENLYTKYGL